MTAKQVEILNRTVVRVYAGDGTTLICELPAASLPCPEGFFIPREDARPSGEGYAYDSNSFATLIANFGVKMLDVPRPQYGNRVRVVIELETLEKNEWTSQLK